MWGVVLTRVFARSSRFEQGCNRCTDIECMSGPAEYTDRHFLKRLLRARGEFDFDFAFPIPVQLCFLFHRVVGGPKYLWTRLGSFRSRARNGRIEYCLDERRGREGIRKSSLFRFFFFLWNILVKNIGFLKFRRAKFVALLMIYLNLRIRLSLSALYWKLF